MIAERAIANKTNMVTASYLSQGLMDQHQAAVDAGVTVVNECGVDPGESQTRNSSSVKVLVCDLLKSVQRGLLFGFTTNNGDLCSVPRNVL